MTRIAYVYHASNIGGGSYCLLNILKALDRTRYTPVVILKKDGPLVRELEQLGICVYFIPLLNSVPYNRSLFTLHNLARIYRIHQSLSQFKRLLQQIEPDVLYCNSMMLYPYLKVGYELGIKTIMHIREHWPVGEHVWQRNRALEYIRKYATSIIAINTFSASMIENAERPVKVVYDWIDLEHRYKEISMSSIFKEDCTHKKIYLTTGGYDPIKGTWNVIKAFSSVITDENSRLLILGTPPANRGRNVYKRMFRGGDYRVKLDKAIASDSRIRVIPNVYELVHLYEQAYCVLSFFRIPHANLGLAESIILKTPAIAATTPESIEYSDNGSLAILFNINDSNDFAARLLDLTNTYDLLKRKLETGAFVVKKMFDPARNIEILNQIYDDIVKQ